MGRSHSEPEVFDLDGYSFGIHRVNDPDDEFAEHTFLDEGLTTFVTVLNTQYPMRHTAGLFRVPSRATAELVCAAWKAGRDSVSVTYG